MRPQYKAGFRLSRYTRKVDKWVIASKWLVYIVSPLVSSKGLWRCHGRLDRNSQCPIRHHAAIDVVALELTHI